MNLPNYGEFDEKRVFSEGSISGPYNFRGVRIGIPICEEIWNDMGVCETLSESGAEILLVPNGSPYYRGKLDVRHQVALRQVIESGLPLVFANRLGGQDEPGIRWRKLRFQCRQDACLPDEPVRGHTCRHRLETHGRWLALRKRAFLEDSRR